MGLVALWHMGSSWTRDGTRVPCIARWILNHWTTREAVGNVLIALCGGTHLIFTITQKVNFIAFYFHFASFLIKEHPLYDLILFKNVKTCLWPKIWYVFMCT